MPGSEPPARWHGERRCSCSHTGVPTGSRRRTRVPAMAQAVDLGADGVELDVHRTADGALVVRHDAETPAGPLGRAHPRRAPHGVPDVPTLAEVLDVCRGTAGERRGQGPGSAGRGRARRPARGPGEPARATAGEASRTTCWCRRSTGHSSTGCARRRRTSRRGCCRSDCTARRGARHRGASTATRAVHPDVWTLLTRRRRRRSSPARTTRTCR